MERNIPKWIQFSWEPVFICVVKSIVIAWSWVRSIFLNFAGSHCKKNYNMIATVLFDIRISVMKVSINVSNYPPIASWIILYIKILQHRSWYSVWAKRLQIMLARIPMVHTCHQKKNFLLTKLLGLYSRRVFSRIIYWWFKVIPFVTSCHVSNMVQQINKDLEQSQAGAATTAFS